MLSNKKLSFQEELALWEAWKGKTKGLFLYCMCDREIEASGELCLSIYTTDWNVET